MLEMESLKHIRIQKSMVYFFFVFLKTTFHTRKNVLIFNIEGAAYTFR